MGKQIKVAGEFPVDTIARARHDDAAGPKTKPEELDTVVGSAVVKIHQTPYLRINVAIVFLVVIAIVAAFYLARAFFVPLLIGILASYTLSPLVEGLKKCYIPRAAGAALVLAMLVGGLSWIVFSLNDDTAVMIEKLIVLRLAVGCWGLLPGAPLVAITKVIGDRVDTLKPIGALLGRRPSGRRSRAQDFICALAHREGPEKVG